MKLSIIIVNWNSAAYTADCISSIHAAARGLSYEIVVVDNASSDDSAQKLQLREDIHLIASPVNLGFAQANNLGYEHASSDVLLFLNPDTQVLGSALERMYDVLLSSESLGIVGCRLLNSDMSLQTSCVLAFPTILNQLTDVEALKVRFPEIRMWGISSLFRSETRLAFVEAVSGACLMIGRKTFEEVGKFSREYFMYCEDVDLCYKVARAGYRVGYVADARVVHHGGQSSKKAQESSFADVMGHEAIRTFMAKWRGWLYARVYTSSMLLSALVRLVLLGLLPHSLLGKDPSGMTATRRKWLNILSWSLGRERWTQQLGGTVNHAVKTASANVA
jgi:N-acetylglucosaminyl-diphospho-decaprenol L-rhamnosyltransferase